MPWWRPPGADLSTSDQWVPDEFLDPPVIPGLAVAGQPGSGHRAVGRELTQINRIARDGARPIGR